MSKSKLNTKTKIEDFIVPKAGAYSVKFIDSSGQLHDGRALELFKAINDLKISSFTSDRESMRGGVTVIEHPLSMDTLLLGFTCNAYHYRACEVTADYIAGTNYAIIDRDEQTKSGMKLLSHKIKRFFGKEIREVEDYIDRLGHGGLYVIDHLRNGALDLRWSGNCYFEVIRDKVRGKIRRVRRVNSRFVWKKKEGGFIYFNSAIRNSKAIHFREFGRQDQNGDNEIYHIKIHHPLSEFYGIPPIANAWSAIAKSVLIDEFNETFFSNNAIPQYAVTLIGAEWKEGSEQTITEHFRQNIKGQHHKTLVLKVPSKDAQIKFEPLAVNVKDGSFSVLKKECMFEVLTADATPPAKVGVMIQGALNGESTQEQLDDFESLIVKQQMPFESFMDLILEDYFGPARYEYKVLGMGSRVTESKARINDIRIRSGEKSINQIRIENGDDPYENPDADGALPLLQLGLINQNPINNSEFISQTPTDNTIQDVSLNGAQISSLLEIINQLTEGIIPIESAAAIITASFPALDQKQVNDILKPLKGFKSNQAA